MKFPNVSLYLFIVRVVWSFVRRVYAVQKWIASFSHAHIWRPRRAHSQIATHEWVRCCYQAGASQGSCSADRPRLRGGRTTQ